MVIDWGKGALAWHQWLTDRTIMEIRPRGRVLAPFRDFLRNYCPLRILATLQRNLQRTGLVAALSAVGGIYLIVDSMTGAQYVGSAAGSGGIWRRWCDYAKTGAAAICAYMNFAEDVHGHAISRFSILETFSRSLARGGSHPD